MAHEQKSAKIFDSYLHSDPNPMSGEKCLRKNNIQDLSMNNFVLSLTSPHILFDTDLTYCS